MTDLDAMLDAAEDRAREQFRAMFRPKPRGEGAPKKKHGNPERDAQRAVVAWLRKAGCIVNANINEQAAREKDPEKRARFGAARKASGATTGFPDLTVILPDGRTVYVEMKSQVGRLSKAQVDMHAQLERRGCVVVLGRDIWSVQAALYQRGVAIPAAGRLKPALPQEPLR